MGQSLCYETPLDNDLSMDPLSSLFKEVEPFIISPEINSLIDKISTFLVEKKIETLRKEIIDPRNNELLITYESTKYGYKLIGSVKSRRPVGECLFYFGDSGRNFADIRQKESKETTANTNEKANRSELLISKKYPLLITTNISPHYTFSPYTLIIYHDYSYYIGEIMAKKYQAPKATGQGLLVTKEFIYEGEFDDGFPEGYGQYRTRSLEYTGWIKKGIPCGECIEKTAKGMFIGRIDERNKVGFLITHENKRLEIHESVTNNQMELNI